MKQNFKTFFITIFTVFSLAFISHLWGLFDDKFADNSQRYWNRVSPKTSGQILEPQKTNTISKADNIAKSYLFSTGADL